ncbi:hypothetical protein CE131_18435 [Vibrio parahaemolyticus]|nr:hypothetical protein CE131_18435 [Vibrio parahaemolyticus]OXD61084.1 hypothetical protein CA154_18435 [Vibrio parahaemolyticus]
MIFILKLKVVFAKIHLGLMKFTIWCISNRFSKKICVVTRFDKESMYLIRKLVIFLVIKKYNK